MIHQSRITPSAHHSMCPSFVVRLWVWEKNTAKAKCHSHHFILGTHDIIYLITGDAKLDLLRYNSPPSSFYSQFFRSKSLCAAHTQEEGVVTTQVNLEFFCKEHVSLLLHLSIYLSIYLLLFMQSLIQISMEQSIFFCTRGYNPLLLYFLTQIASVLATGRPSSCLPCPFDMPHPFVF